MPSFELRVNGGTQTVDVRDPDEPPLYLLRNRLGLTGARYGRELGQCGAPRSGVEFAPNEPPPGAGEAPSTPVAAALANAVYDAAGIRLRMVPFTRQRVLQALG